MGKMKLFILVLLYVTLDSSYGKTIVRVDKDCAIPNRRRNLPQCDWHYMAYFPRIFRSGVTENVIFSTHGFPNDVEVNVLIYDGSRVKGKDIEEEAIPLNEVSRRATPGLLISIPVTVPHNAPRNVRVVLQGEGVIGGDLWKFNNMSQDIRVEKLGLSILIQTDRPLYKPGQIIRSRVVVVDSNLKPFNGKLDKVSIVNPSDSTMRIWRDTPLVDGFSSFELKTSVKPVLGKWKIKVLIKSYKKELTITVDKYVLPKFQVTVSPPSFISKMMKRVTTDVCAKYSYGKPVVGKMNATVCLKARINSWYRGSRYGTRGGLKDVCSTFSRKIDGCTILDIDLKEMKRRYGEIVKKQKYRHFYSEPTFYTTFRATVKESATGIFMSSKEETKNMLSKDVKLSIEAKNVFKPGFPLSMKIFAKRPDGTPVESLTLKVSANVRGSFSKKLLDGQKVHIKKGMIEMDVPTVPFNAKNLHIRVTYMREKLTDKESNWKRTSSADKRLKPWYSPSHSYLNVHKQKEALKVGSKAIFTIGYTSVDTKPILRDITYSMMCGGNIVKSDSFKRVFIPADRYGKAPIPTTTTTTTTTTTKIPKKEKDANITLIQIQPKYFPRIFPPMWWEGKATRPPMPYHFSTSTFSFTVDVDRKMLPSCRMVVYYIRNEEVVADETEFKVLHEPENQISMEFDTKEAKPGEPVKLIVKGAPKSRIAIAAVDKSIHFLAKGNDIKPKHLVDIQERLTISPGYVSTSSRCGGKGWYGEKQDFVDSQKAFSNVGTVFLTSLRVDLRPCEVGGNYPVAMPFLRRTGVATSVRMNVGITGPSEAVRKSGLGRKVPKKKKPRARTEFPETWLWTDERLSENGTRELNVKVPDTITAWYASGFGLSQSAGLGVANPTELRVFQPFFISMALPYSVIRDEDVTIPAAIFSYLDSSCITVKVSLQFSPDYKMIAGPNAKTCLCSGRTATVLFRIRAKKLGHIKIRIMAETLTDNECAKDKPFSRDIDAADILVKKLLVEPEGIKEEYTRSTYFCPNALPSNEFKTDLKLKIPDNLVPGSIFAKVTAIGDIMGSSLSNIDQLLAMPYGCGEQNMLKFAPNIFIMNYLNNTNQVTSEIKNKALDYMRTGYQRELTYKHDDGAYSAFGKRDKEGSTWLTAFVLKSYAQARPWIDIDEAEVKRTSQWLMKLPKKSEGCFPVVGSLHNKAMAGGGVKNPATLTAYVMISLLEAGFSPTNDRLESAYNCVNSVFSKFKLSSEKVDTYSLSIMAYLFAKMGKKSDYDKAMRLLDNKAIKEDGMKHWEEENTKNKPESKGYYYKARSTDIEQTSYVLLAILTKGGRNAVSEAVPIVRWLSKQRNSLGGWSSTQDTVLAMQALAEFAESSYSGEANMRVSVNTDGFDHSFDINSDNKLVLQRVEDVPIPSTLKIVGNGVGCALIQTNVKYNVKKVIVAPSFVVKHDIESIDENLTVRKSCRPQMIKVCARWVGEGDFSNMAMIDVQMISGFEADQESFDKIRMSSPGLKDIEVKEKSVMFYFNKIGKREDVCVKLRVDQTTTVRKTKPAPIKVYDYYDTGKATTIMYQFKKAHCIGVEKRRML